MEASDDTTSQPDDGEDLNDDIENESDIVIEDEDEQPKDVIKRLRENLKECTAKKQEYLDGWQRAKADMINTKKEFSEERKRIQQRTREDVIGSILPVLDSFEMAFADQEAWNQVDEQWRAGVENIHSQLKSSLENYGLKAIKPEVGDKFDPKLHTSVDTKNTQDVDKSDTVAVLEKTGYQLDDRVIRSANVVVFKAEEDNEN